MSDGLDIWVVFQNPADYPGKFVLRRQRVKDGKIFITNDIFVSESLLSLRRKVIRMGLYRLERQDGDPPMILESWL